MIKQEAWVMIRALWNQGLSKTEISRRLNIDRKTVAKYIKCKKLPRYKRSQQGSELDPYKEYINNRLDNYNLTSEKLYEELQRQGYSRKYGIVNLYVREKKKDLKILAVLRFETLPGEQSQVDWGSCGEIYDVEKRRWIKLNCFTMILGYSRMRFVRFYEKQDIVSFLDGHNKAFEYYGGHTKEILYDNLKSVVIKRRLKAKDSEFNKYFMDFAGYYGFKPILARPYKPNTKGKIENSVKYVKQNFVAGEEFKSLNEINERAMEWNNKVNNKRHSTTKDKPFNRLKKESLIRIENDKLYDLRITYYRKVQIDCHFSFRGNFYSVPYKYAGKEITIRENKYDKDTITVRYRGTKIAEHSLSRESVKGKYITIPEHLEGLKELRYGNSTHRNKSKKVKETDILQLIKSNNNSDEAVETRDLKIYEGANL